MDLCEKFRDAAVPLAAVSLSSLYIDMRYPVLEAERVEKKYWQSIRLTIREGEDNSIKVFLSRRYSDVFTDDDVVAIKGKNVQYYLTYKGKSSTSNSFILQIDV